MGIALGFLIIATLFCVGGIIARKAGVFKEDSEILKEDRNKR